MTIPIYIGAPGMEEEITTKGIRINAPIYPGATVSVIPSEVINKIHKKQKLEFGSLKAHRQEDTYRLTTTQILIGVEVSKGRIIPVGIDCIVNDEGNIMIGKDVLQQLPMNTKIDYKNNKVVFEPYDYKNLLNNITKLKETI